LARLLGIEALRIWRLHGFPLTFWYFEPTEHIESVKLVGQRQDQGNIDL